MRERAALMRRPNQREQHAGQQRGYTYRARCPSDHRGRASRQQHADGQRDAAPHVPRHALCLQSPLP